jgi:mono/diheme cytochrome c family protein
MVAILVLAGGCSRGQPRDSRPVLIIPDMEFQGKMKAQNATPLFEDGRTMRTPPAGTVARGTLKEDPAYFTGKRGEEFITHNPRPVTKDLLERGRARFNIYCSPCHDRAGTGKGIVLEYGLVPPPDFAEPRALEFQDGYIFDVITNGIRNMPGYAAQVPVEDRWAIVAYFRAIQRSRTATLADVPADQQSALR